VPQRGAQEMIYSNLSNNAQLTVVISKKRSKALLSLMMALFILGTANHCIFEDLFVSFSKVVFGTEEPHHLPNHLGSNAPHKHSDSSEPHKHGQPHPVLFIHFQKAAADILKLMVVFSSLCFVAIYTFGHSLFEKKEEHSPPYTTGDPPGNIENFINSLTLAPQAPPL
jgi:hypothetical protein